MFSRKLPQDNSKIEEFNLEKPEKETINCELKEFNVYKKWDQELLKVYPICLEA